MKTSLAVLAAIAAVSVAVDLPPVGPTFLPPTHATPARCDVPRTLGEAHDALARLVAPDLVRELASRPQEEVRADRLRIGLWMREFWGLWNRGALRDHLAGLGLLHPDGHGLPCRTYRLRRPSCLSALSRSEGKSRSTMVRAWPLSRA